MTVKLVLDDTALLAFTLGSPHVGETIGEVADEGGLFTAPVLCLAETAGTVTPDGLALLNLLVAHPCFTRQDGLVGLVVSDWRALGRAIHVYGTLPRAAAAMLVRMLSHAYVVTAMPDSYDGLPTIGI